MALTFLLSPHRSQGCRSKEDFYKMGQQPSSKSKLVNFTDIINRWLSISMYVTATPVATIYKLYLPYNYFISKINMNI